MPAACTREAGRQEKAGAGCSAGGVLPWKAAKDWAQWCWGRTRRGNNSSEVPVSQLAWGFLPQRPAAMNDPAPRGLPCSYGISLEKAVRIMCIWSYVIFSVQRNTAQNTIESERECVVPTQLPSQCIVKDSEYKANCKGNINSPREDEWEKRGDICTLFWRGRGESVERFKGDIVLDSWKIRI